MKSYAIKKDLILPKLSYDVVGCAFKVHKELGGGLPEKVYGNAYALELQKRELEFERELPIDLVYSSEKIGQAYADFVVDNQIVVELKVGSRMKPEHFSQTMKYIQALGLRLGMVILFTGYEVRFKRVVNFQLVEAKEPETIYRIESQSDLIDLFE